MDPNHGSSFKQSIIVFVIIAVALLVGLIIMAVVGL